MSRVCKHYCRHCGREVLCSWKGTALYCVHDHYVRPRGKQRSNQSRDTDAYKRAEEAIAKRFNHKGDCTWGQIIEYCENYGFTDLVDLCNEVRDDVAS